MASGTITLSSNKSTLAGRINWKSTSNGSSANTSSVYAEIQVKRTDSYTTKGTWTGTLNINENKQSFSNSATSISSSWVTMKSFTITKSHNSDGSGTCYIAGWVNGPSGTTMEGAKVEGSSTVTLDKIPRYATINSFSAKSKSINTIVLEYSTNATVDKVQYMYEGGSWADMPSGNKLSSLTPNKTYKIRIQVRRKDSQLWTTSSYISVTTYDYAKLSSVPNVNIGSSQTIKWINPNSATTTLKLCKTDGTTIIDYGTVTGTSKTVTPTASTIYALTPNSNTYKARYILTTTQNSTSYTNYKDFTFTVTSSNPTFSNFTYADTNSTTTALTGNNQKLIAGYSTVKATISTANKAVAKNSATMKKYRLSIGTKTAEASYSSSADVSLSISSINGNKLNMYAIDSRGNSTTKQITPSSYINYSAIKINTVTATRSDGGVGETVTLYYKGTMWSGSFGSVSNGIKSISYKYKKTSASSYTTGTTALSPTVSGTSFSQTIVIKGDTSSNTFDTNYAYNIQVTVSDKLSSYTYTITLQDGTPLVALHKNGISILESYDTSTGGALQVKGSSHFNGNVYGTGACRMTGVVVSTGSYIASTNEDTYDGFWKHRTINSVKYRAGFAIGNLDEPAISLLLQNRETTSIYYRLEIEKSKHIHMYGVGYTPFQTILYSNASGSSGTITLSASAANYNILEVFYTDEDGNQMQSIRAYNPNGKKITLDMIEPSNSAQAYAYQRTSLYNISGTSINYEDAVYIQHNNQAVPTIKVTPYIKITRVLGWNW